MGIYFNKEELQAKDSNGRAMRAQYNTLQQMRQGGSDAHAAMLMQTNHDLEANEARTPAEAYREMDQRTKIIQVPAGEFSTLTRLMGGARAINLGRKLYEYRKVSDMDQGQASMSGTVGVKSDKVDYEYGGVPVPVFDKGFGIDWRDELAMRAEGFDALVDYSREAERGLMTTIDNFMWDGDASLVFKGESWLGLRNDPTVASAVLGVDLSSGAASSEDISNEVARVADILWITNNCASPLRLAVSREIMSNLDKRVYSTATGAWGTILQYIEGLRYFAEVYEDSNLSGNQIAMYLDDQMGFHMVSGMAMSTYANPRLYHNSPFTYTKWAAMGFVSKNDTQDRKCALYAE